MGDVRDVRSIEQVFRRFKVDILYHAAAMKHVVMCEDFPLESVQTNILGTQNVTDLALEYRVPKVITISTDKAAYPSNVMGACKFIAERITLNANKACADGQSFSCVRFGNVANSRGSVIPVYVQDLLNRRPLQVTDPEVTRFIMEIPDAVRLVTAAAEYARGGEVFILKMRAFRLGDLVEVMTERIAPRLEIPRNHVRVVVSGLVAGEKLHEDLISRTEAPLLYELADMYLILSENVDADRYLGISKASLPKYASNEVPLMSKAEIEQIVLDYLASAQQMVT